MHFSVFSRTGVNFRVILGPYRWVTGQVLWESSSGSASDAVPYLDPDRHMTSANTMVSRMLGAFALGLFHLGAYYMATRVTVWRGPQALVDTRISLDPLVPHLPWAWPLYWLPYVFVFGLGVAALVLMPRASYRRAILAYAGMIVIGASIQMVFPALAPWPDGPAVSQRVFHESPLVLPYATLPSMHVAFTTLTSLIVLSVFHQRVIRAWAWAMPPMVIVATLVLKEHVMLDAVAGGLLAGLAFWWWRAPSRQTVDHPDESTSRDGSNGGQHTLGLSIAPVEKKGRKEFFRVPWRVYRGNPCWSPPFPGEEGRLLNPRSNPDLAEAKHRLWIAKTADGPVGRIAAFAPHLSPDIGYFGFFHSAVSFDTGSLVVNRSSRIKVRTLSGDATATQSYEIVFSTTIPRTSLEDLAGTPGCPPPQVS